MYLRTIQRRNKDGSVVRYVQIAHNKRVNGVAQADVLVNLGREDHLDRQALSRLVASINRYLGDDDAGVVLDQVDELTVTGSKPLGAIWLLDGLWHQLDIGGALREAFGDRMFTTDMERVLFALVANRVVDPMSKLSAAEWVTQDVVIPGLVSMSEDQAYRAMDALIEADTQAGVQEAVFFQVANLLNLDVDVILFDTTSTYWECDGQEDEGGFRRFGHSKDHRDDLPQIVIGLAVTKEGIPVRCWCWPGETTDMTVVKEVRDGLRQWRLGRVITITDRGFSSGDNLNYLRAGGGHFIAGERMRAGMALVEQVLACPGRYRQVTDNLQVKQVHLPGAEDRKWVVCFNREEAFFNKASREAAVARVVAELARIAVMRTNAVDGDDAHVRAECALRDHKTLGRWVKQLPSGRLALDKAKIKAEARLDGKYLLVTSDLTLPAADVALSYKNLLKVERGFRDLKCVNHIELRPVYHRLEHRIRAHVLLCWLALLLTRVAETATAMTWRRIAIEMGRLHAVTLTGPAGVVCHTTNLTDTQKSILSLCHVDKPPAITHLSTI